MFKLAQREKFGPSSERVEDLPSEQLIFNEVEKEASLPEVPEETQTITYTKKKGRSPKKPFPEHLPREEKIIDLSEEEKVCPNDGARLEEIGEERTEKFKTIPAQMSILVEVKKKYACPCCELYLAQPKSNSILPGTIATPECLDQLDKKNIKLLGCLMHSRRRFHKAFLAAEEKPGLACDALAWFKWLYAKEEKYKERGLAPAERKAIRDKEIRPALKAMKEWPESKIPKVPKSSPLGNALNSDILSFSMMS
jgi:Transposase IS66 family/Transposase C of IS166 homeodomain/zinc-finger binding domain of transposase IS66